ncbi:PQQ-dependent sugar dehydrogenase [Ramlibacter rhizophilus]|uniref:PQQ-dependent sugar dehydrogenase n=1 Tax=Ramlibacter rhizophilus TaxID=1781167 RepID=A0A4Z0BKY1_9BURK|nr:PQQ-dependent sugar dehydrogenase [Ramlibacter rhizophilus]TFY98754.1 PQQ-dependent sugar dehydrogenase [Ramlibacter rhizophilus]
MLFRSEVLRWAPRAAAASWVLAVAACGGGGGGQTAAAPEPAAPPVAAAPDAAGVQVRELDTTLDRPWGLAFLPDGRLLVTERGGGLRLLSASGVALQDIAGTPAVDTRGQGGLLGIALDPDFARNRRVYLSFSEPDAQQPALTGTAVARAVWPEGAQRLQEVAVIWRQQPKVDATSHYGSRLVFDGSGALFVTTGDRNRADQRALVQDPGAGPGKIVRITTEGQAAAGNPGWDDPDAIPGLWSLGHRNAQGAALHPGTGELWISEHGPDGGDEINRVLAGRNYGWPRVSRGYEYGTTEPAGAASLPAMEEPVWSWEREDGAPWTEGPKSSIAPAGIAFYTAAAVPQWRGSLFVTSLAGRSLWRLTLEGNRVVGQERLLASRGERLRDVAQGPDGALYLLTDSGKLLRYGAP